jgi:AmmeMemoRadiSam system protein B
MDQAHELEHSLEVHLPFLQTVLKQFTLIPIVCGDATAEQVCTVIEQFWSQPETLIVISSDLSHFHDYETAKKKDKTTSEFIEQLKYEELDGYSACGYIPISGLLALARKKNLHIKTIDLKNSADTAGIGEKISVVGYGTYVIE